MEGLSGLLSGAVKIACSFLISSSLGYMVQAGRDSRIQGASDWVDDTNVPTFVFRAVRSGLDIALGG